MPTITITELEVYSGTSVVLANRWQQITEQGAPLDINIGNVIMGELDCLYPGSRYSARARCTNSGGYTSEWTPLYPFKTLISIKWAENLGGQPNITLNQVNGEWHLGIGDYDIINDGSDDGSSAGTISYNTNVTSPSAIYVYVNTSNDLSTAVRLVTDEQDIRHDYNVTNTMLAASGAQFSFQENQTYYVWLGITDDTQDPYRTYVTESASVSSGVGEPVIILYYPTHTYESVGITADIQTNETITSVIATLTPIGGGTTYTLTGSTSSTQTFNFTNGNTDSNGNTISISPNTTYRLTVTVATPIFPSTSEYEDITTDRQPGESLTVVSVTNIGQTSATVNLFYGS